MADKQNHPPARKPKTKSQPDPFSDLNVDIDPVLKEKLSVLIKSERRFSGPVPPAEMAEGYEKLLPGSADRFLTMAEKEQSLYHQRETGFQKNDTRRIMASTLTSLSFAAVAVFAIWAGHPIAGVFIVSIGTLPTVIRILLRELFTPAKD